MVTHRAVSALSFWLVACLPLFAQSHLSEIKVFGGYSFFSNGQAPLRGELNGFGTDLTLEFTDSLGATVSYSRQYAKSPCRYLLFDISKNRPCVERSSFRAIQVLAGPRFTFHVKGADLFAHSLGGFSETTPFFGSERRPFAMGYGFGADLPLTERISFRAFQLDYIPVRTEDFGLRQWRHDFKYQTGLVFRFGGRSKRAVAKP